MANTSLTSCTGVPIRSNKVCREGSVRVLGREGGGWGIRLNGGRTTTRGRLERRSLGSSAGGCAVGWRPTELRRSVGRGPDNGDGAADQEFKDRILRVEAVEGDGGKHARAFDR